MKDLRWQQLVLRRSATTRSRDVTILEVQTIVPRDRCRLIRESGPVKRAIEPIATPIPCEHSSGSIAAMGRRGKPNQEKFSMRVAEARVRFSPVLPLLESSGFLFSYLFSPLYKSWTKAAADYVLLKPLELSHPIPLVAIVRLFDPIEKTDQVLVEFNRIFQIAHVSGLRDNVEFRADNVLLHGF